MKTILFIVLFLLLGAFFIISNKDLALRDKAQFESFTGEYYSWISGLFDNAKHITSYVVKSDWLPTGNYTNSSILGKG